MIFGGLIGGTINLIANWNNADNFWQGLGYFGVGAAAGVASAAIGGAGIGIIEAATFGGAASGALISGGNVAMQGGGAADIFAGAIGGGLIGGSVGFLGGAAMMGLGEIASNIQLPKMRYANTGDIIKMHPKLNDAFAHYTNIILGSGSTNLYDYFIAGNGTHLRVDQYNNYNIHKDNGTAPQWMLHNYYSWTKNINHEIFPEMFGRDVSLIPDTEIYLGDYTLHGNSEINSIGGPIALDAYVKVLNGDKDLVARYNLNTVPQPISFSNKVRRLIFTRGGRIEVAPGTYSPFYLRIKVRHTSSFN